MNAAISSIQVPVIRCLILFLVVCSCATLTAASAVCFGEVNNEAYLSWVNEKGSAYNISVCYNATSSDTTQGVAIHWKIDEENLYLAVAARAEGWVGFGLAEAGGMRGADMVIFESANPGQVRDAYVLDQRVPLDDTCQDWVFLDSRAADGFLIFEAYRKLDTLDTQDRAIINDANPSVPAQLVIAAWGDSPTASYHGPRNVVRASVRWYGTGDELTAVREKLALTSDGFFDLKIDNYPIKPQETEYQSFCFNWDPDITSQDIPNEPIAVIAAEVLTDERSARFVHHADVFGSLKQSNTSRLCLPEGSYGYSVYSWATGIHPFLLPDDVGYTFGPTSDNSKLQSFRIQVHYNNPELIENVTDGTALRIYYSKTPRKQELGIMAMGDALSYLEGVDIPAGLSQYDFTCQSDCSILSLNEPITVFQEGFHMHISGVSAVTYHIRNGETIRQGQIDFYDFDQAGLPTIRQEPFTVMPGDSFVSKFWFNSKNGTKFGKSSYEEMNKAVFVYYPAKTILNVAPWSCTYEAPIDACNSSMAFRSLTSVGETERKFGKIPNQCSALATPTESKSLGYVSYGTLISMVTTLTTFFVFLV